MEGARLPGRGPPFIMGPFPFIIGTLPFTIGPPGPPGPLDNGADDSLGGGGPCIPFVGAGTGAAAGLLRLAMLTWWRIA
jgi:hypothetical protein